jgi:hypothetical protein
VIEAYMGSADAELKERTEMSKRFLEEGSARLGTANRMLHGVDFHVDEARSSRCWAATAPAAPPRCAPSWA